MNTKLLKQKILDLAIRGKLTDQRKSDGTAADLLKEICDRTQEKTSLRAKRGNPSPQTIIPLDKSEAPFEIPANWEWVKLGNVCLLNPADKLTDDMEVSFVPMVNIGAGFENRFISEVRSWNSVKSGFTRFANGDIAVAKITPCFENRKSVIFENLKNGFGAGTTELHILRTFEPVFNKYIFWYVKSEYFIQNGIGHFSGAVGQQRVGKDVFFNACLPLPPLAEQQRIVKKIEETFAEIDAVEKNKELLKTHIKQTRQKILDLAIHGKLVPQNKSDEPASVLLERITRDNPHYEKLTDIPFEIPESWEWVNAEDLFNIRSAIRIHQTDWQKEGIPFFRGRELVQLCKTGNVDFEIYISEKMYEENKRKGGVPQKNDILVSAVGTLGFAYVVKGNKPFYYKDAYILCFENRHNLNPFYFQHLIHSKFINKIIYGGSKGTTVDQLTIENAKKLPMPLPPLAEQKRIVNKIEEIFASLDEISLHLV